MLKKEPDFLKTLIKKSSKLIPILDDISKVEYNTEIDLGANLIHYIFQNAEKININLNRLLVYVNSNLIAKNIQVKKAFLSLIDAGLLVPAFSLTRMAYEHWAASVYLNEKLIDYLKNRNEGKFHKISDRLFTGARYPVSLPWGEPSTEEPIHIKDMLRELEKTHQTTSDDYNFLCEFAHPNCLYNLYSVMASIYWHDNPIFEKDRINELEKQFTLMLTSLKGIKSASNCILTNIANEYNVNISHV
jgi:hypothetical protein